MKHVGLTLAAALLLASGAVSESWAQRDGDGRPGFSGQGRDGGPSGSNRSGGPGGGSGFSGRDSPPGAGPGRSGGPQREQGAPHRSDRDAGPRMGPRDDQQRRDGPPNIRRGDRPQADDRGRGRPDAGERGGPRGRGAEALRGERRLSIQGRNYTVWHDSRRVRRDGRWRTVVPLASLGALTLGGALLYPYAYIDAPAGACSGFTEDGCRLRWREVPTLDGPRVFQCVAYCPWQ